MSEVEAFKPATAEELAVRIWAEIAKVVTKDLQKFRKEVEPAVLSLSRKAVTTAQLLATGKISRQDADLALHTQELALSSLVLYSAFLPYDLAQGVLETVMAVAAAAIEGLTGVRLNF